MNWINYRDEHEHLSWLKEDKVMELQELISTWLFKTIISNPKEVEFKIRPWYEYVSVFINDEFQCYITKGQWIQFADDTSVLNKHFMAEQEEEEEVPDIEPDCPHKELDLDFIDW